MGGEPEAGPRAVPGEGCVVKQQGDVGWRCQLAWGPHGARVGAGDGLQPGDGSESCPCHVGLGCDPVVRFACSQHRRIQLLLARASDFWAG